MLIIVQRIAVQRRKATVGMLAFEGDEELECFTLEDVPRPVKVPRETRIPAGLYQVKTREAGTMYGRYVQKFAPWHRGMLWLQDVPGFEWIYLHPGNTDQHTAGCILVGDGALIRGELVQSTEAYRRVYTRALAAIQAGEPCYLEVKDEWRFTS